MAERQVPNGGEDGTAATGSPASGPTTPTPGGSAQDAVQAELDEARKRLRSQERAHQRDMKGIKDIVDGLKAQLTEALQGRSSSDAPITIPQEVLNALDPSDPKDKILLALYQNQSAWSKRMYDDAQSQTRTAQLRSAIEEAIEDEVESGVPRAELLAAASPDAVRATADKWRSDERVRSLERQVADLSKGRQTADEAAAAAALRTRQSLGATTVLTSTGEQPPLPSAIQQEVDRYDEQIALAKRQHKGADVLRLSRERQVLIEEGSVAASP